MQQLALKMYKVLVAATTVELQDHPNGRKFDRRKLEVDPRDRGPLLTYGEVHDLFVSITREAYFFIREIRGNVVAFERGTLARQQANRVERFTKDFMESLGKLKGAMARGTDVRLVDVKTPWVRELLALRFQADASMYFEDVAASVRNSFSSTVRGSVSATQERKVAFSDVKYELVPVSTAVSQYWANVDVSLKEVQRSFPVTHALQLEGLDENGEIDVEGYARQVRWASFSIRNEISIIAQRVYEGQLISPEEIAAAEVAEVSNICKSLVRTLTRQQRELLKKHPKMFEQHL